jgi:hypothetical protein
MKDELFDELLESVRKAAQSSAAGAGPVVGRRST